MPVELLEGGVPGRVFACGRCQAEVVVCSACDRGQRYCGRWCSAQMRQACQRGYGSRYQRSPVGRWAHAGRQARYRQRQRQKEVTHQSSQGPCGDAVLASEPAAQMQAAQMQAAQITAPQEAPQEAAHATPDRECVPESAQAAVPARWRCHWCARTCDGIVRSARQAEARCKGRRVHLLAPPGARQGGRGRPPGAGP